MSETESYNPYAPPASDVGSGAAKAVLERRSLLVMFVLVVCTLGIYYLVWFFRRRFEFNRLDPTRDLKLWPLLVLVGFYAVSVLVGLLAGEETPRALWGSEVAIVLRAVDLGVFVLSLSQSFALKDVIEDYVQKADAARDLYVAGVELSGILTFFFTIFYLQYAINKHIVDARR